MALPAGARTRVGDDARAEPRVRLRTPVELLASTRCGPVLLPGVLVDLSAAGCALRLGLPLEPGVPVRLVLALGRDRLPVLGEVIWAKPRERTWVLGIRFERLAPAKRAAIVRCIFSARRLRQA